MGVEAVVSAACKSPTFKLLHDVTRVAMRAVAGRRGAGGRGRRGGPATQLAPSELIPSLVGAGALGVDPLRFADERADDLQAVASLLAPKQPPVRASAVVRLARQEQRLLRRRTGSSVVKRWRTRKPVPATIAQERLGVSRRDRRRASVLRARAEERGGLTTEAWHAKRFQMVRAFGIRLPWRAHDRSVGSAVRAANEACVLHDASYHRVVLLSGEAAAIAELLERSSDLPGGSLAQRLRRGREVACHLHQLDSYPAAALGPARLLPCHSQPCRAEGQPPDAAARIWLFIHHAALSEVVAALTCAAATLGSGVGVGRGPRLARLQLRGPLSHAVLCRALALSEAQQAASAATATLPTPPAPLFTLPQEPRAPG